jgi:hypothetical protein
MSYSGIEYPINFTNLYYSQITRADRPRVIDCVNTNNSYMENNKLIKDEFGLVGLNDDKYLPRGTKLYHGTLENNLKFTDDIDITYFGLDFVISTWYTLEQSLDIGEQTGNYTQTGILYEFELTDKLRIDRFIKDIDTHPSTITKCIEGYTCLHVQFAYHDNKFNPPFNICYELTLNTKELRDKIRLLNTYNVDLNLLYINRQLNERIFDPKSALSLIQTTNNPFSITTGIMSNFNVRKNRKVNKRVNSRKVNKKVSSRRVNKRVNSRKVNKRVNSRKVNKRVNSRRVNSRKVNKRKVNKRVNSRRVNSRKVNKRV